MTLIERYLHAVRTFLPASRQDDIIRELSEDIHSQVMDREEALGRPMTEAEQSDLLKQFGHPMLLASKYRPRRYLIGAATFPFYWFALKMALGAALLVHLAIAVAMIAAGRAPDNIIGRLATFPINPGITVFGWVTLVFALIDVSLPHLRGVGSWNPRTLPTPTATPVPSRVALICEIIATTGFLLWWLAVPHLPFLILGPGAAFMELTPGFLSAHLPIAALWLISLAGLWTILLRPDWARFRVLARALSSAFGLVAALVLLRAGKLVAVNATAAGTDAAGVADAVNVAIHLGLIAWACVSVWELLRAVWRSQRVIHAMPRS